MVNDRTVVRRGSRRLLIIDIWLRLVNKFINGTLQPQRPPVTPNLGGGTFIGDGKADNFLLALDAVLEELRSIQHPEGAVVLILKDSGQLNNSG